MPYLRNNFRKRKTTLGYAQKAVMSGVPRQVWHHCTASVGRSKGPRGDSLLEVLCRAQLQAELGPSHKPHRLYPPEWLPPPWDRLEGLPQNSGPSPPAGRHLAQPGRKAHDFPQTQGHRAGVEEVAGSCPWWRLAWARTAAGPRPGAPAISPQTSGTDRLAPGSPAPGWSGSQALAHTSKG